MTASAASVIYVLVTLVVMFDAEGEHLVTHHSQPVGVFLHKERCEAAREEYDKNFKGTRRFYEGVKSFCVPVYTPVFGPF